MTNPSVNVESGCECRYTLTLTDQIVHANFSEMNGQIRNIHEIEEDDTDDEYFQDDAPITAKHLDDPGEGDEEATREDQVDTSAEKDKPQRIIPDSETKQEVVQNEGHPEDEDCYTNESFYSDDSYDEPEEANAKSRPEEAAGLRVPDQRFLNSCRTPESGISEGESKEDTEERVVTSSLLRNTTRSPMIERISRSQTRSRRRNMSFTDDEARKIERENQLLLRKIMAQQRPRDKIFPNNAPASRTSSSAINRKRLQRRIEYDNMLLLQRIQQAKSCVMNTATRPGCRLTFI